MRLNNISDKRVYTILDALRSQRDIYVTGGVVRDSMMNVVQYAIDIDMVYGVYPKETPEAYMLAVGEYMKRLNIEATVIPTGLRFGVFRVLLKEPIITLDIAHFRTENYQFGSRNPSEVKFVYTIEEDLGRRDFTINAIAMLYKGDREFDIIDPYNGIADIKNKVIKAVGNPIDRFKEDPLKAMRALRFASRFGFKIEDATFAAIKEIATER